MSKDKIYIASDFHLGIKSDNGSSEREEIIIEWLDSIKSNAKILILLGDTFDYWFEYRNVVPKGFNRFIGKLAELTKAGTELWMFTGNHDVWFFDYFPKQLNAKIYKDPISVQWNNKSIFLAHGDGLGPGDHLYKFVKSIFRNRFCQWLFKRIHPDTGISIMKFCSKKSRELQDGDPYDENKERLISYCEKNIENNNYDFFIFGHRHLPIKHTLSNQKSVYFNTGDWLNHNSYLEYDGNEFNLKFFKSSNEVIYGKQT